MKKSTKRNQAGQHRHERWHTGYARWSVLGVLILLAGATAWYVAYGQRAMAVASYDTCVHAGGKTDVTADPAGDMQCTAYGKTFIDTGYLQWNLGQRYTGIAYQAGLPPAQISHADRAPAALVAYLRRDNASCGIGSPASGYDTVVYDVLKAVDDTYVKLAYGCRVPDAFMLAANTRDGWRLISPTNQFTSNGTPSCAMVNFFAVSKRLEPVCWRGTLGKTTLHANQNP